MHDTANGKSTGAAMSEAAFLQQQAEEAAKAVSQVLGEFSKSLRDGADPRLWTKEHPWAMVAGATVAGFATAAMLVPSKEDQALRRLAAMERALMPEPTNRSHGKGQAGREDDGAKDYSKGRAGFMGAMGRQLLEAIKPALLSALTAGITAKAAVPENEQHPPPPSSGNPNQGYAPRASTAPDDPSAGI